MTGGTSTPIEDLRDVAERIFVLAGTDDARSHAAELARGALDAAAHPAGRTTSLPTFDRRRVRRRGLTRGRPPHRRPARRRLRRPPQRRQEHALQPRRRRDRAAIVEDRARTTRDRLYGDAEWNGRRFVVVDTGGLEISPGDPIEEQVQLQARLAIAEADVIVFLVDAATGPTPADLDAAEMLRRTTKPVLLAANKADNERRELDATEFYAFGWEDTFAISANHGRGVGDLLDAIVWALPPETEAEIARKAKRSRGRSVGEGDGRGTPGAGGSASDDDDADRDDDDDEERHGRRAPARPRAGTR